MKHEYLLRDVVPLRNQGNFATKSPLPLLMIALMYTNFPNTLNGVLAFLKIDEVAINNMEIFNYYQLK